MNEGEEYKGFHRTRGEMWTTMDFSELLGYLCEKYLISLSLNSSFSKMGILIPFLKAL